MQGKAERPAHQDHRTVGGLAFDTVGASLLLTVSLVLSILDMSNTQKQVVRQH